MEGLLIALALLPTVYAAVVVTRTLRRARRDRLNNRPEPSNDPEPWA